MAVTGLALAAWVVAPGWAWLPAVTGLAAAANLMRLARWQGHRTGAEPLVWILHLGFFWLPVGLALIALAPVLALAPSAALHALTGGAMTTMIVAVSTRATRGHTGRALYADWPTTVIYLLVTAAALARTGAGFAGNAYMALLTVAGGAWTAAFALYLIVYAPMLLGPRKHA